ncbi:hypothetical protein [Streptomyces chrestomyceticus]|uniref:hypothetical protein n=1 Tax=Streptomyces chrestomyceticus TaxID=68185 RepID=UPI0004C7EE65
MTAKTAKVRWPSSSVKSSGSGSAAEFHQPEPAGSGAPKAYPVTPSPAVSRAAEDSAPAVEPGVHVGALGEPVRVTKRLLLTGFALRLLRDHSPGPAPEP